MKIQWFPGHMNKAQKAIAELCPEVDVIVELLDARAPLSSCNPLLQSIVQFKRKIMVLNKSDLADESKTQSWLNYFNNQDNTTAITGNANSKSNANKILKHCKLLAPSRGTSFEKPLRIMIIGIPNVGKSTLINQLVSKKSAKTGDVPAVTKNKQKLYVNDTTIVYDTPGMMWQKLKYPEVGLHLALCNSIGRNALDEEMLALYLIKSFKNNPDFVARYKLKPEHLAKTDNEMLELIATKRGCIMSGGIMDLQKSSEIVIQDFRDGKFGKITLETPEMWQRLLSEFREEEEKSSE